MVGQWTVTKPSRSDEVLDADQQLKIANEIRAQFESMAPKRPVKPNRSESDSSTPTPVESIPLDQNIPELDKFRALQSKSHVIVSAEGSTEVQEDYVETQYYNELHSIDKQHHTTGNGFIRVVGEGEGGYDIQLGGHEGVGGMAYTGFRSNPATNDWVPKIDEDQGFVSSKPNRSESS
ncbi:Maternal effect embryo arrest 59, putative isoform 1 [Fagus crenata]